MLRKVLLSTGLALVCALGGGAPADGLERRNCPACRRIWLDSPARMRFTVLYGKHPVDYYVCSPTCFCELLEDRPDATVDGLLIVNYKDRENTRADMQNAERGHYLLGIPGDEERCEEPYTAAFRTEKAALEAREELGGKLADWETVLEAARKVAEEQEEKPREKREPLKKGGR